MGSIPGPIISFKIDSPQLAGATAGAFQQVKNEARQTSNQIADDWKRMAAQIRASMALGTSSAREEAVARERIVSVLNSEISAHRTKAELSARELSNLKAMTLELERQKSHLVGTGGLTTGTLAAAGQMSTQTYLGVTRALDSIVNRYFGGAAGSAFRTIRDLGYYSSIGANGAAGEGGAAAGAGGGIFASLKTGASAALEAISPLTLGVGAFTVGLAANLAILAAATGKMFEYAQAVQNAAAATGLSYQEVQRFNEVAKITGIEAGSLETAFARAQVQLGEYITKGKAGSSESTNFVRVLGELGVSVTDASGKLRPITQVLGDFGDALSAIPDRETRTALGLEAMGTRGRVIVQLADEARASGESLTELLEKVKGAALSDQQIQEILREKQAWESLKVEIDSVTLSVEAYIATHQRQLLTELAIPGGIPGTNTATAAAQRKLLGYFTVPGAPSTIGTPTAVNAQAQIAQAQKEMSDILIRRAEVIQAGDERAFELEQKRKDLAKAIANNQGDTAFQLASQIASTERIIALEKQQLDFWKQINEQLYRTGEASGHPHLTGQLGATPSVEEARKLAAQAAFKNLPGLGISSGIGGVTSLGALGATAGQVAVPFDTILKQIQGEHDRLFKDQFATDQQHYHDELAALKDALNNQLISYQQYSDAVHQVNQDINKSIENSNRRYQEQAGHLFDQLISGDRNFGRTLVKDLQESMLAPIRDSFDKVVGNMLGGFSRDATAGYSGATSGLSRFATVPFFGKLISGLGLGGKTAAPDGTETAPFHVVLAGAAGTGAGLGGGLGNLPLTAGIIPSLLLGGGSGFSALSSSAASGPVTDFLNAIGYTQSGPAAPSASARGVLGILSKALGFSGSGGGAHPGFFGVGGKVGSGVAGLGEIGGGLLMGLGASTGGALGGLEGAAGGALSGGLTGFAMGGPVGAAVGAIIGGIGGLISGIIGPGWQTRVQRAERNQAYYAPPSETFSFAENGSIGSTMGTGFSQSGGRFSQFGLPSNTPFYASALTGPLSYGNWLRLQQENNQLNTGQPFLGFPSTDPYAGQGPLAGAARTPAPAVHFHFELPGYLDANSAHSALMPIAETLAKIVSSQAYTSGSGFGNKVRALNNLP